MRRRPTIENWANSIAFALTASTSRGADFHEEARAVLLKILPSFQREMAEACVRLLRLNRLGSSSLEELVRSLALASPEADDGEEAEACKHGWSAALYDNEPGVSCLDCDVEAEDQHTRNLETAALQADVFSKPAAPAVEAKRPRTTDDMGMCQVCGAHQLQACDC